MTGAVAYVGTYDPAYPRNAVIIAGLRELGVTVHEFRAPLPQVGAAELATAAGAARIAVALAAAHVRLLVQHRRELDIDAVVVGYPGHFLVPFAKVLSRYRHVPLVFDPLVSLRDTFAGDRALVAEHGLKATLVSAVDRVSFGLADLVLADTWAHAAYYQETLGVPRRRLAVVPVGAVPVPQATGSARPLAGDQPLVVFQYGKWSPLHGAADVLGAAALLRDEPFRFVLAGEGQLSEELRETIRHERLDNVEWLGAVSHERLRDETLAADVCLGVFGRSEKAARVVPNKVYDGLACGRPVVTADSPAARELLRPGADALLVPAGDAGAIAAALRELRDDALRAQLGAAALAVYRRACTPAVVAGAVLAALRERA